MDINRTIDHTLLKPDATQQQIAVLCEEAKEYQFASVCVNSYWVPFCTKLLKDSGVNVCTVIGFPLGAVSTEVKAFETAYAVQMGAKEVDMVINIGELKAGHNDKVSADIEAVVQAAAGAIVKVIIETCLLTQEQIIAACQIGRKAGADFVKTSTGFSTKGAVVEDVRLMKDTVGDQCQVKASGGIRSYEVMQTMLQAGASRIGTSAGVEIMQMLQRHK